MTRTTTELTAAVETYLADLGRVRATGGAIGGVELRTAGKTAERCRRDPIAEGIHCVGELADHGPGHPDFALYAAKQVQKGRPREAKAPERGVVEVTSPSDDAWLIPNREHVGLYWARYQLLGRANLGL